jgi:HSP20 family protein
MPEEITRRRMSGDLEREYIPLRALMDRMMENAFMPMSRSSWGAGEGRGDFMGGPSMDVDEDENAYHVRCHLPGVKPEEVTIRLHEGVLTISGETRRETKEGRRPVHQELQYGRFERQLSLPGAVDVNKVEAEYHDGILEISLPKSESSRPRTIQVKGASR